METKLTRVARLFDEVLEYLTKIFLTRETRATSSTRSNTSTAFVN